MKNIQAVKIGNVVNVSIDGKLHKKNCGNPEEANELYKMVLKAKTNPTDDNIKEISVRLNEKLRVAMLAGLESDPDTGEVYLAGFNTPLPAALVEVAQEYHDNNYPMDSIINFWKLLMLNPDKRVRTDLFDFITTHDFVLTDNGYMVVYKAVYEKENENETKLAKFVSQEYLHVKKDWKTTPKKYMVYADILTKEFFITKKKTAKKWDEKEKGIEILGNLEELNNSLLDASPETDVPVFTDMYSQSMTIMLGEPVKMERKMCDADYRIDCSNGLHVGATKYVEKFANWHDGENRTILVCYVNPANVVAVPEYDHSKMRVCEYFPFAIANWDGKKIDIIEQAYFESDYTEYEVEELEKQIEKVHAEELPIKTAKTAEPESRPMSELLKIIKSRLLDVV